MSFFYCFYISSFVYGILILPSLSLSFRLAALSDFFSFGDLAGAVLSDFFFKFLQQQQHGHY